MIPKMETQTLRPQRNKLEIKGKLSYRESTHSWCLIRLSRDIIQEFPQLKERNSSFGYKMVFYPNYGNLEKFLKEQKKEGEALPILVWLVKDKKV